MPARQPASLGGELTTLAFAGAFGSYLGAIADGMAQGTAFDVGTGPGVVVAGVVVLGAGLLKRYLHDSGKWPT